MSSDISVDVEDLHSAAKQAKLAADSVARAQKAGASALPSNAFGVLCSPLFLPIYQVVEAAADTLMGSMSQSIERAANNLDTVADAFADNDANDSSRLPGSW